MARGLTVILALAIAALTLLPYPPGPPGVQGMDKLVHLLAFAALAAPLAWRYPNHWAMVALAALAYGGVIEIVQPHVGRAAEGADVLADGLGAFGGAWFAARLGRAWQTF
ncbi:MAG: VanZ family protein [Rhodobacteraceae bacterium CG17_big_fil_post_rev_8_21_14_2_50_63_15]|nr:VanZ family protein [Roseovarius sp.]PIV79976.1 MAG: VanZ family protein [Rhodobacteraceae bacterium CG17_big_fil_post_rev_8_21_14_2_50_63_15]